LGKGLEVVGVLVGLLHVDEVLCNQIAATVTYNGLVRQGKLEAKNSGSMSRRESARSVASTHLQYKETTSQVQSYAALPHNYCHIRSFRACDFATEKVSSSSQAFIAFAWK
jgi:hypothetical protein